MKTCIQKNIITLVVCIVIFLSVRPCDCQTIAVTGSWSVSVGLADLQGGPGTDFNNPYESPSNQIDVDIWGGSFGKTWAVQVQRVDISWDTNLTLEAQAFHAKISGGTPYQEITTTNQELFRSNNSKNAVNIDVQLRLSGVSLTIGTGTFTTTVYYTLVDL